MQPQRPPRFEPAHSTAQEEAYQYVLHGIRMGVMRPGERLVPDEIATAVGMSRMPVREALSRLATEGLIVVRANRGAVVRELTEDEVQEVFEMRAVLEGLAASMAATRANAADFQDLEQLLARMQQSASSTSAWITVHRQFHERLCAISAAPRLMQQISALHAVVEPLMRLWLENGSSSSYLQDRHEDILTALKAGDPEAMEAMVRAHVRRTVPGIVAAMNKTTQSASVATTGA
jgi:DNA-binding GntR family transcriptional regulator